MFQTNKMWGLKIKYQKAKGNVNEKVSIQINKNTAVSIYWSDCYYAAHIYKYI